MLHIICHDVANQFAVASMAMELITTYPDQDFKRFLPRIAAAVKNGIGLTGLVREMRRVEDKEITLESVSLRATLAEALLLTEDRCQAKKITVRSEVPDIHVIAEPCSLTNSVFGNLFTNAIKFPEEGAEIEVSAQVIDGAVCVSVRDYGIGMPPEILEHLFDVSKSVSRLGTAGEKGTGFGMPLMRKFVIQFGGSVDVVTRDVNQHPEDHGTEFRIHLRLAGGIPKPAE